MKHAIWILWPSFLTGAIANACLFTLIDPFELEIVVAHGASRMAAYTAGFFGFWLFGAVCSAFTCFLQRSSVDINRLCPLEPPERPIGCPKRECPLPANRS
jgi:hypothetical protein